MGILSPQIIAIKQYERKIKMSKKIEMEPLYELQDWDTQTYICSDGHNDG